MFIRIRGICSDFSDYLYFSRLLTLQLQKRGYSNNEICFNSRLISKVERNHLIPYKTKNSDYLGNCIFFKIPFEKNLINLDMILKNTFQTVSASVNFLKDKKFKTLFKINPNITSLLIHGSNLPSSKIYCYQKCTHSKCSICRFSYYYYYYLKLNNFYLPIFCDSTCKEINCVYILHCSLCNYFYIGQTVNFKNRLQAHISNIKNFIPYKKFSSVSTHFNLLKHDYLIHLKFYIIQNDLNSLDKRLNFENDLINLFLSLNVKTMNYFIPNKYYLKILK